MTQVISTRLPAALNSKKYHVIEIDGRRYYEHRVKALGRKRVGGAKSKTVVDHIDSDTKHNGKNNLRVMSRGANVGKANALRPKKRRR